MEMFLGLSRVEVSFSPGLAEASYLPGSFFLFFILFYLILAALGLCCCV